MGPVLGRDMNILAKSFGRESCITSEDWGVAELDPRLGFKEAYRRAASARTG